eukprot:COSAG02_NODE_10925_length_1830_cov_187.814558_2_plen_190_part_01
MRSIFGEELERARGPGARKGLPGSPLRSTLAGTARWEVLQVPGLASGGTLGCGMATMGMGGMEASTPGKELRNVMSKEQIETEEDPEPEPEPEGITAAEKTSAVEVSSGPRGVALEFEEYKDIRDFHPHRMLFEPPPEVVHRLHKLAGMKLSTLKKELWQIMESELKRLRLPDLRARAAAEGHTAEEIDE